MSIFPELGARARRIVWQDYADFKSKLDQIHPPYGQTIPMDFGDLDDNGGKGL